MTSDKIIAQGLIQNPPVSYTLTIKAFEVLPVQYDYNYIRVTEGNYTRGDLEFRFSNTGQASTLVNGQAVKLPQPVQVLTITNTTNAAITLTIDIGIGDIYDDRLAVSGTVLVATPAGGLLQVDDDGCRFEQVKINRALREMDGVYNNLTPKTPLGDNVVGASNVLSATLVTPAANTGGLIIRTLNLTGSTNDRTAIYVGTSAPSSVDDTSEACILRAANSETREIRDIMIESGNGIYYIGSNTGVYDSCFLTYDLI